MLTETRTELGPDQGLMCELNKEGDTKIIWNRSNPDEVAAAQSTFNRLVRDKKFLAYSVEGKEGEKGKVIREFDPNAERIILAPPMVGG